jgi:hypothetical protein
MVKMIIPEISSIKNAEQARDLAIEWQSDFGNHDWYWSELADWQAFFYEIARKYRLVREFKENAII